MNKYERTVNVIIAVCAIGGTCILAAAIWGALLLLQ